MRRAELEAFRFVSFSTTICSVCLLPCPFRFASTHFLVLFTPLFPCLPLSLPLPAFSPATIFARRHKKVLVMFNILIATPHYPTPYYLQPTPSPSAACILLVSALHIVRLHLSLSLAHAAFRLMLPFHFRLASLFLLRLWPDFEVMSVMARRVNRGVGAYRGGGEGP